MFRIQNKTQQVRTIIAYNLSNAICNAIFSQRTVRAAVKSLEQGWDFSQR
jgi:hypothetical protein